MDFIIDLFEDLIGEGIGMMILVIVLSIIVAIGLFFLFRALICWYLKINKLLKELQKTNSYLERIVIATEQNKALAAPAQPYANVQAAPQAPKQSVAPAPAPVPTPAPVVAPVPTPAPAPVVAPVPVSAPVETPVFEAASAPVVAPEKKCASCGSTLKEGTLFCVNCGAKVEPEA